MSDNSDSAFDRYARQVIERLTRRREGESLPERFARYRAEQDILAGVSGPGPRYSDEQQAVQFSFLEALRGRALARARRCRLAELRAAVKLFVRIRGGDSRAALLAFGSAAAQSAYFGELIGQELARHTASTWKPYAPMRGLCLN